MSAEKLVQTIEKLLKLHKSLYEIAQSKTEVVKTGDMEALNQILKDEQAHLAAISRLENERQKLSTALVPETEKPTIQDCLQVLDRASSETLGSLRAELLDIIAQIQQQNILNQKLILQSLQFVNFSLNLFRPQTANFNYGPNSGKTSPLGQFPGLINSKA